MSNNAEKSKPAEQRRLTSPQNLFWAAVLISAGVIMLFDSLGLLEANISALFSLWPLLIIYFGLKLLLRGHSKTWPYLALAIVTVGLAFGVTTAGWLGDDTIQNTQSRITSQQDIDELALFVETSASNITINTDAELDALIEARLDSRLMSLASESSYRNGTKSIELSLEGSTSWWPTNWKNDLDIDIGDKAPLSLSVDAGATDLKADLSNVEVKNLHLRLGASSNDITLGEASTSTNISIDAGASSITLRIPRSTAIIMEATATVGSIDAKSLTKRSDGMLISENYDETNPAVDIKATIGAGAITVKQY